MKLLLENLAGSWALLGGLKIAAVALIAAAFIPLVRQRDLASSLRAIVILSLPAVFLSGLLPLAWRVLPIPEPREEPAAAMVAASFASPARPDEVSPRPQSSPELSSPTISDRIPEAISPAPAIAPRPLLSPDRSLLLLWLTGAALSLAPVLFSWLAAVKLRRQPSSPELSRQWLALAGPHAARVPLRISPDVSGPGLAGLIRPVLLLPPEANTWSTSRLRSIFLHEGHHIRRKDVIWRELGRVVRAALWFHPVAWWAQSRLVVAQERAADEAVLAHGVAAPDYAFHLLAIAAGTRMAPGVAMARSSQVGGRIRLILSRHEALHPGRMFIERAAAVLTGVVAMLVTFMAFIRPSQAFGEEAAIADYGFRPPIIDRHGRLIATSDPTRMPENRRENTPVRWYPEREITAHLTGIVTPDGKDGVRVGKRSGLEDSPELEAGRPLQTTIDLRIQRLAWKILEQSGKRGAMLVSDAASGEILAAVSWPAFNPNLFAEGITPEQQQALDEDEMHPLANHISRPEPPASLFKFFIGLSAAKADAADRLFHCGSSIQVSGHRFSDWNKKRDEMLDLPAALSSGCNTYFIPMAIQMGPQPLLAMGKDFAFGGAGSGPWIPCGDWHGGRDGLALSKPIDLAMAALGQGSTRLSLVDCHRLTDAIASGKIRPAVFVKNRPAGLPRSLASTGVDERELGMIRRGMIDSFVTRRTKCPGGLAASAATAMSEVQRHVHVAFCSGYAPLDAPRFVVSLRLWSAPGQGASGVQDAGPLLGEAMNKLLREEF
ncbi:penicillin-binding transpeptidase domain-containing protein [Luteolibacter sp. GHJ8]|uniref:Penicillin-binding transpeptidase domain-containing protein n=1 Tax=Luteolibacter rhizosphaerae TaxID=2989719 RepID=A0ABT3G171_9BACT|nr:M56 family metallopeptidase [Luteolibacter rhizosphaerae]MCW1913261.1 penicillin-binding transpeptidase domain-containing protein [Luteolibacter rhizosphaerae]